MTSGTAAGAVKPITMLAFEVHCIDWLRAGDSHDVPGSVTLSPQQDEYTFAAESRFMRSEIARQLTCKGSPYMFC